MSFLIVACKFEGDARLHWSIMDEVDGMFSPSLIGPDLLFKLKDEGYDARCYEFVHNAVIVHAAEQYNEAIGSFLP